MYQSGDTAGAIDAFGREACGPNFRERFDQTLPPGYFERWVGDAKTQFEHDMPALQSWRFTQEEAAGIRQPVVNLAGESTTSYCRTIYETLTSWMSHAESDVVPDATHCMMQTNPEFTAKRIAGFFAKHPMGG